MAEPLNTRNSADDSLAQVYDTVAQCAHALKDTAPHLANEAWNLCGHINNLRADRAQL